MRYQERVPVLPDILVVAAIIVLPQSRRRVTPAARPQYVGLNSHPIM